MARFSTTGLDDLIDRTASMGLAESEVADKMLLAGAEKVKFAWRQALGLHGIERVSGQLIDSIGYARKPKDVNGIKTIDIYPQGTRAKKTWKRKNKKGKPGKAMQVRNADVAFILHYGSSRIKATHFVDTADELAADPALDAMEEVFDNYLKESGMI